MNNKGWGLQMMLVLTSILIIALLLVALITKIKLPFLLSNTSDEHMEQYALYLEKLEDKAEEYAASNFQDRGSELITISYTTLKNAKYIEQLTGPSDNLECNGYVLVKGNEFTPYLKCGLNYKTKGYNFQNE